MNINSDTSLLPSYLLPFNSTANSTNSANSASSAQQQADVLGLSPADQFLAQLQQVQTPQQFQAMISQTTGQPLPAALPTAQQQQPTGLSGHHCQGGSGHQASSSSESGALNGFQASSILGPTIPPQESAF